MAGLSASEWVFFFTHCMHRQTFNLCLSFDQQEPNSMNFSMFFFLLSRSISRSFMFNSTICSSVSSFLFNASSNLLFDLRLKLSFVWFSTCILCSLYEREREYTYICVVNIIRRNVFMMNFVCVLRTIFVEERNMGNGWMVNGEWRCYCHQMPWKKITILKSGIKGARKKDTWRQKWKQWKENSKK